MLAMGRLLKGGSESFWGKIFVGLNDRISISGFNKQLTKFPNYKILKWFSNRAFQKIR